MIPIFKNHTIKVYRYHELDTYDDDGEVEYEYRQVGTYDCDIQLKTQSDTNKEAGTTPNNNNYIIYLQPGVDVHSEDIIIVDDILDYQYLVTGEPAVFDYALNLNHVEVEVQTLRKKEVSL
jgi:hypothetical protein